MDIERFREICLSLPEATEDMPFDETVVVFRLKEKIFGCIALDKPEMGILKCDPELAIELRERYPAIQPAYHWSKKYWNQILFDGSVSDDMIADLARHSYNEVNKKLPKKLRVEILETNVIPK